MALNLELLNIASSTIDTFGVLLNDNKNFLGLEWFDKSDVFKLVYRFAFNFLVTLVAVRYIYYPIAKRKDYLFTYLTISATVFLLCFLLENVKLELGFALGLFAIFGIIRYRTDPMPIKEMTYLFLIIGLSVINALANKKISHTELFITNGIILATTFALEKLFLLKHESRKTITYEKIELIKPENRAELQADLEERTGLVINRIEIGRIDFLRDVAQVRIYYFESDQIQSFDEA